VISLIDPGGVPTALVAFTAAGFALDSGALRDDQSELIGLVSTERDIRAASMRRSCVRKMHRWKLEEHLAARQLRPAERLI
jgi:hypothetical protein